MEQAAMQSRFNSAAKAEAERLLTELGVAYTRQADGSLYVAGSIDLSNKGLTALPDLSMVDVNDDFFCDGNLLTDLTGAPRTIAGAFDCSNNGLTALTGAPESCAAFMCANNALTSLKGAPQTVMNFYCDGNRLTDLTGGPQLVPGTYDCGNNALDSLIGAPSSCREFICSGNRLVTLRDAPARAEKVACDKNNLICLEHAPRGFSELKSDFGAFTSWHDVPDDMKTPEAHHCRQREAAINEAIPGFTVLGAALRVSPALKFRR